MSSKTQKIFPRSPQESENLEWLDGKDKNKQREAWRQQALAREFLGLVFVRNKKTYGSQDQFSNQKANPIPKSN